MSKKILGVVTALVIVAAVLVGVNAQAQTVSCANIDAMLSALGVTGAAQIAQAKVAFGCGTTAPAAAYTFTRNLTIGSTGADVTALQTKLGVSPATGYFGAITKAAVVAYQTANGIVPASGYVGPLTLAKLNYVAPVVVVPPTTGGSTGSTLTGGAGDSEYASYSTGVKSSIKDGEEDVKVAGLKIEAIDSDISVNNIRVELVASGTESTKVSKYIDSVDIYMGSKKVGSEDVADFSKTGTTYYKSIALSNAVVSADEKEAFFVVFNAVSDIDEDNDAKDINVDVVSYRFTDGDGVVDTKTVDDGDVSEVVELDLLSANDVTLKSSSSNPANDTIAVDEDNTTDDVLALVFKIDNDEDSTSDVTLTSLPVVLTFAGDYDGEVADSIIETVTVSIDGTEFEAEVVDGNSTGTAEYVVDLDGEDVVVAVGETAEVKVYLTFAEADNYTSGMTVKASVDAADIDAEDADEDVVTLATGSKAGALITLSVSPALITAVTVTASKDTDSTIGTFAFKFTLEADGEDIDLDEAAISKSVIGGTGTTTFSIIKNTGTVAAGYVAGTSYTVEDGNKATFTVTYTVDAATAGTYYVTLNSIADVTIDETTAGLSLIAD